MTAALAPGQRLGQLEDPCRDFPFYNGAPVGLTGGQWLFVMAAVAAGFAVLVAPILWPAGALGAMIPAVLFPLIPMVALAQVAPGQLFGEEVVTVLPFLAVMTLLSSRFGVGLLGAGLVGKV